MFVLDGEQRLDLWNKDNKMAGIMTKLIPTSRLMPASELDSTLEKIGLKSTLLTKRPDIQQDIATPDEYHNFARAANKTVFWLMVPKEELDNIRDSNTSDVKNSVLHGNMRLLRWDKLLLATSPSNAETIFQHLNTELHISTKTPTEAILVSVEADALEHLGRQAVKTTNVFNKGYLYPQVQLKSEQNKSST
jgi:hypothetical protein